jgi:hypothetical protein
MTAIGVSALAGSIEKRVRQCGKEGGRHSAEQAPIPAKQPPSRRFLRLRHSDVPASWYQPATLTSDD